MKQKIFHLFPLYLLPLITGCAFKVPVLRVRPATFDVANISKIGIVAKGPQEEASDSLDDFAQKVKAALEWSRFFKEVRVLQKGAAQKDLDALLNLESRAMDVLSFSGVERTETLEKTGRLVKETYYEGGEQKVREVPEVVKRVYEVPTLRKDILISLDVVYAPLQKGRTPQRLSLENREVALAKGMDQIEKMMPDSEMLQIVSNPLIPRITNYLVPRMVGEKIKLASHATCQKGLEMAKQGNWQGALESWQAAAAFEDANHAAHYNIGVAFEALKNYKAALGAYQKALQYSARRQYRKAMERLEEVIKEDEKVQRQMKGRI